MAERDFEDSGDKRLIECCRLSLQDLKTHPRDTMPLDLTAGE
jgi:hypothetical protein